MATWRDTIAALAPYARVIAPDNVGFGNSDGLPDGGYVDRTRRGAYIKALLNELGVERATLVGHSEGGFVALRMAIEYPELSQNLIIVSSGSAAPVLGGALDDGWRAAGRSIYDYSAGAETVEGFLEMNAPLVHNSTPAIKAMLSRNYHLAVERGQLDMFRRSAAEESDFAAYMAKQTELIDPFLAGIDARTWLIWGAQDPTAPTERAIKLARLIPGADLCVLSKASHMVMWDRTEAFNAVLRCCVTS